MATGDLVEYEIRLGLSGTTTRLGLDLGDGRVAVYVSRDGRRAVTIRDLITQPTVIAAAGAPRAVSYANDLRGAAGSQRVPADAFLANGPAPDASRPGPDIPDVVGTVTGVYGEENRQRLDAASPRGASAPSSAGTGNS